MKRKPNMNSLGAALFSFSGGEVPSSESLLDQILNCATTANRGEVDDEHVSRIVKGLLEAYLAACALEDEDDEDELETLGFEEAERQFNDAYAKAYGPGTGRKPEDVEVCDWPDFLPHCNRFTHELAVDLGRLVGFLDVQRCKAYTRYAEQHEKEAGNALQAG
jgi:hypothetical protein